MAFLLHIDTATEYGAVAVSHNDTIIAAQENSNQKEHASFVHPAIQAVIKTAGISITELDAIAVTIGPGSYTGLRVGLTAAKGLCYVLQKPLIAVNTLQAMALASIESSTHNNFVKPVLYAPMIDARRMEVYTGLYTNNTDTYNDTQALVIDEKIFAAEAEDYSIVFSGSGSKKLQTVLSADKIIVNDVVHSIRHVAIIAYKHFLNNAFEDVAYCEPFYLKSFYSPAFVKK